MNEPPGLCIGKVRLEDGSTVLGVLGEPALVQGIGRSLSTEAGAAMWRNARSERAISLPVALLPPARLPDSIAQSERGFL